ncbi:MAG TPA: 23S rRNA (pseudouridine(1915)-N(3))-methyltransferase RlmH [Pyrinomonadaceae bacterium]|nr:23S rRNA (pseudouridine(1915)-N(3))-methyltransferase RlmH [Pyrinomonadaceae bacterium]
MRLHFVWPGKTKNRHLLALQVDYYERLSHFARCQITELRESGGRRSAAGIDAASKRISDALSNEDFSVLLDVKGSHMSSDELAQQVEDWEGRGTRAVAFIVGGPDGVSDVIRSEVSLCWSLSPLTLTHEMARVLLLEQLYRAYAIIHRLPYAK